MSKIAIITDSNSGVSPAEAKEMGVTVVPMPFFIDDKLYFEDIDLTKDEFFRILGDDGNVSTSQPSPGDLIDLWEKTLEEYDEIVHIPMSSGLSTSCATAMALAQDTQTILMDEPTTYLDVSCQLEVMALARRLAEEGRAVVMVLHDLTLALRCAHRAVLLSGGRIRQTGTPEELYRGETLERVMGVPLGRAETETGWRYFYR